MQCAHTVKIFPPAARALLGLYVNPKFCISLKIIIILKEGTCNVPLREGTGAVPLRGSVWIFLIDCPIDWIRYNVIGYSHQIIFVANDMLEKSSLPNNGGGFVIFFSNPACYSRFEIADYR